MNEKRGEETEMNDRFPHLSLADKVPNMIDSAPMTTSFLVIPSLLLCCAQSVGLTIAAYTCVSSPPHGMIGRVVAFGDIPCEFVEGVLGGVGQTRR